VALDGEPIPGIGDTPEIDLHFEPKGFRHVPGGGVGEVATVPVAAAIVNAVHDATGVRQYDPAGPPDRLPACRRWHMTAEWRAGGTT
jgi:xanthine dehydrogenase YagR molybdenum-binding subunit